MMVCLGTDISGYTQSRSCGPATTDTAAITCDLACCPDAEERELLNQVADLLYDAGDPRGAPWPDTATLNRMRTRLRALTDGCELVGSKAVPRSPLQPTPSGIAASPPYCNAPMTTKGTP